MRTNTELPKESLINGFTREKILTEGFYLLIVILVIGFFIISWMAK